LAIVGTVGGSGSIAGVSNETVIADQTVLDTYATGTNLTTIPFQDIGAGGVVTPANSIVAVKKPVTIAATGVTGTTIAASSLSSATLYVVGKLTVQEDISSTTITGITVFDNVEVSNAGSIKGDVTATGNVNITSTATPAIAGNVTTSGNVTTDGAINGDITAGGDLTINAAITGAITAAGAANFSAADQATLTNLTAASINSSKDITTSGNINLPTGQLKTTGSASVTVGGTLSAGTLEVAGDLTTAGTVAIAGGSIAGTFAPADAVTTSGALTIGTLAPSAAVTLEGNATISNAFTSSTDVTVNGVLTIVDTHTGTGKFIAEAPSSLTIGATAGYTTTSTGVTASGIGAAITAFASDTTALTTPISLHNDFGTAPGTAIGTVPITSSSAAAVKNDTDAGDSGNAIEIDSDTTLIPSDNLEGTVTGTDVNDINSATFTLSVDSGALKLADSGWANNSAVKYGIVTFTGLKLQNSELISPVLPAFSIGVKTER
jgi:cytoskeletal protein CcmA (bactofilin family)